MSEFAWPAAVLGIAVAFMLIFKGPLGSMIGRVRKIGHKGAEMNPDQPPPQAPQDLKEQSRAALFDISATPAIKEQESSIIKNLEARKLTDSQDRERALVRSLALQNLHVQFERAKAILYRTQLLLLRSLNVRDAIPVAEVRDFFAKAKAELAPAYDMLTFEGWLGFLESHDLVQSSGEVVTLKELGKLFLIYLTATGANEPAFA